MICSSNSQPTEEIDNHGEERWELNTISAGASVIKNRDFAYNWTTSRGQLWRHWGAFVLTSNNDEISEMIDVDVLRPPLCTC